VAVGGIEYRRNPALGPTAGTIKQAAFRDNGHPAALCQMQCDRQASQSTTNNNNVKFHNPGFLLIKLSCTPMPTPLIRSLTPPRANRARYPKIAAANLFATSAANKLE
jgi:hypothetical protein